MEFGIDPDLYTENYGATNLDGFNYEDSKIMSNLANEAKAPQQTFVTKSGRNA